MMNSLREVRLHLPLFLLSLFFLFLFFPSAISAVAFLFFTP